MLTAQHRHFQFSRSEMSLREKLWHVSWSFVVLIAVVCSIGFMTLYSAANGNFEPWAARQMLHFCAGLTVMLAVAVVDIRSWMRWSYLLYGIALVLLVAVQIKGSVLKGGQRWIDFGFIQLQPSEIMKITLVL